ncbi:hypothetical protein K0U07_03405, partial [bacterium]|nr:hypothetical protein [bacterium]
MDIYFPTDTDEEMVEEFDSLLSALTKTCPYFKAPFLKKMQQEEYFHSISQSIASMLEEKTLAIAKEMWGEKDYAGERLFYKSILKSCPLVKSEFYQEQDSTTLCITAFCKTSFHQEVGRFITDFFGKWLLPGKTIPLHQTHSATVSFKKLPKRSFFFHEMYIE